MFDVLERLCGIVDELVEADPHAVACDEVLIALRRQRERLAAIEARLTAAFDAEQGWSVGDARNMVAWLKACCRLSKHEAEQQVRLGRALRHMPHVEAAWLAGEIGTAQVVSLNRCRQTSVSEQFARDEQRLVQHAKHKSHRALQRHLCYWRQRNMPDEEERGAKAQRDDRRVHLSQSFENTWFLDGVLDPVSGSIVHDELQRLEKELFQAEWAAARERLGREPTVNDLARTPAQRRADALVEMAKRSATAPADGRPPRPLFTVLVGYETFAGPICELANGTVITPGSLVPWLTEADIERIVFGPKSRIVDVGRRTRFYRGAIRRGIQARDRECFHPLCDEPVEQIDHIEPYAAGGETTQDNGRGACAFHNRRRHKHPPPTERAAPANHGHDPPEPPSPADAHSERERRARRDRPDTRGGTDRPDRRGAAPANGGRDAHDRRSAPPVHGARDGHDPPDAAPP